MKKRKLKFLPKNKDKANKEKISIKKFYNMFFLI